MKVLILSTFAKTGGAAIAARRLAHALDKNGVQVTMAVRRNLPLPGWKEKWGGVPFLLERLRILLYNGLCRTNLFAVDIANAGENITGSKAFKEADVIHLHWINQGFVSLGELEKILRSGKRVVWTMHDQWPMTGVCHYSDECTRFETRCRMCPMMSENANTDVAEKIFLRKRDIYRQGRITFVACSEWLGNMAGKSALGKDSEIISIPNAIDTAVFAPMDRNTAREKMGLRKDCTMILFGCQKVTDKRKGLYYLSEALKQLSGVCVVLVGGNAEATKAMLPESTEAVCMGHIGDEKTMATLYAAADAFVTPSLQDNLPNTIMEAMACGTPCVGFNVGGIPEMIDHKVNGYVARYMDAGSLAEGIRYVTSADNAAALAAAARRKVLSCYSEDVVAGRYINVYRN